MDKYRIVCTAIVQGELPGPQFPYQGLRITPNVYTTLQEIDTFVEAMQDALANGLPTQGVSHPGQGGNRARTPVASRHSHCCRAEPR